MNSLGFCPGTAGASCRSGRGGGPARLARGRRVCGNCSRRAATGTQQDSRAAAALVDRPSHAALADTARSYRERKQKRGVEPTDRTLEAVRTYVECERQRKEHLDTTVSAEIGMGRRAAPVRRDAKQQVEWFGLMDTAVPEGMVLNAVWQRNDEMALTIKGVSASCSECCDAPINLRAADSGDETTPHYRTNHEFGCEECGDQLETHEFAWFVAKRSGKGRPPQLVMPDIGAFADHAVKSRDLLQSVLASDALVDANERLDEFLERGGADDVITGELSVADLREGETGIRLVDEAGANPKPGKEIIQGWAVVDSDSGKNLHFTSTAEAARDSEFEGCLRDASDLGGRLP